MTPYIRSGQKHKLSPVKWEDCNPGDIVYCKIKGSYYTHFVKAKDSRRGVLIGNARGNVNGWTKQVFGKVIEVLT